MNIGDRVRHKLTTNDSAMIVDKEGDRILVAFKYISIGSDGFIEIATAEGWSNAADYCVLRGASP